MSSNACVLAVQLDPRGERIGLTTDVSLRGEGLALVAVTAVDYLRRLVVLADQPRQRGAASNPWSSPVACALHQILTVGLLNI